MLVARPQPHLAVFGALPAGDQVEAEAAVADRIDRVAHPRAEGRRDDERRAGRVDLDLLGDRGEAGHQREALEIILPEFGLAAEAAQLDHREQEIDAVALGLLRDLLVEIEARHILRRVFRDQPAIVADRHEDADFHHSAPSSSAPASQARENLVEHRRFGDVAGMAAQHQLRGRHWARPRRAGPSSCRGRACRPRAAISKVGVAISARRSSMSKASRAAMRASTFAAPWKCASMAGFLGVEPGVILRDPAGRIEEDRLGADEGLDAAVAQQREAGLEAAAEMRIGLRPAVDHDEPVEPLGRARARARGRSRRRRHGRSGWRCARPSPSISARTSSAMSSTVSAGRQRAVAAAGAAMIVER